MPATPAAALAAFDLGFHLRAIRQIQQDLWDFPEEDGRELGPSLGVISDCLLALADCSAYRLDRLLDLAGRLEERHEAARLVHLRQVGEVLAICRTHGLVADGGAAAFLGALLGIDGRGGGGTAGTVAGPHLPDPAARARIEAVGTDLAQLRQRAERQERVWRRWQAEDHAALVSFTSAAVGDARLAAWREVGWAGADLIGRVCSEKVAPPLADAEWGGLRAALHKLPDGERRQAEAVVKIDCGDAGGLAVELQEACECLRLVARGRAAGTPTSPPASPRWENQRLWLGAALIGRWKKHQPPGRQESVLAEFERCGWATIANPFRDGGVYDEDAARQTAKDLTAKTEPFITFSATFDTLTSHWGRARRPRRRRVTGTSEVAPAEHGELVE